jgi:hypothetical protein
MALLMATMRRGVVREASDQCLGAVGGVEVERSAIKRFEKPVGKTISARRLNFG